MSDFDDVLRAANPVNERELTDVVDSPFAQALFGRITGVPYSTHGGRVRRRSRRPVSVAVLVGLMATGAGVSYALAIHHAPKQLAVGCFAEARLDAPAVELAGTGADPIGSCQVIWAAGRIPGQPRVAGPALSACVLPGGGTGVFPDPAGTVCRRLRLTPADTPLPPTAGSSSKGASDGSVPTTVGPVTAMIDSVVSGLSSGCFSFDQASVMVRGALDHAGLATWKVTQSGSFSAERPCASPGFDELHHEVRIIPIPRH